jgi:poly-gamma-glutamate capsule biosynthesis protein CapA/YwtB (metallophosphatase superfamily)
MIRLCLTGDVMTGRGIDQILPHPCDPQLFEDYLRSALDYVALAERAGGEVPGPARFDYIWGDALDELRHRRPDAWMVNLETAITTRGKPEAKGIHYRMNPANLPALTEAGIDCCALSNNHVLDWGPIGLIDTLAAVRKGGIRTAGAGRDLWEASQPASIELSRFCRVLVFSVGVESSGIPAHWAARLDGPGVRLLPDLSEETAKRLASHLLRHRKPGDIVILSIHWGSNWGFKVEKAQKIFAHRLIDYGASDIVHGHSSHHARPIEIYRQRLILYGCGDCINDYEGIRDYDAYRADLVPIYLADVNEEQGTLAASRVVLFKLRGFRLTTAPFRDVEWFKTVMNVHCLDFGTALALNADCSLSLVQL